VRLITNHFPAVRVALLVVFGPVHEQIDRNSAKLNSIFWAQTAMFDNEAAPLQLSVATTLLYRLCTSLFASLMRNTVSHPAAESAS